MRWVGRLAKLLSSSYMLYTAVKSVRGSQCDGRALDSGGDEWQGQFCRLFESIPLGIASCRIVTGKSEYPADFVFLNVNKAFENQTGLKAPAIIGQLVTKVMPGITDATSDLIALFGTAAISSESRNFDFYFSSLDRHYQITAYSPRKGYFVALFSDSTERKRAEEALRQGEQRLRRAQEIAHLGSWELDLATNSLSWSDEIYRIFGLRPQEFGATYEAFLDAVHPDDRAAVDAAYSGSLREGRDTYEIEHRIVRKATGEIRIVHEKCEHIRDESGRIVRSVGMVHDITERKADERELVRSADELRVSNEELARFNKAMVNRELRMIELKKQINELCVRAGEPPRFKVDFNKEQS